MGNKTKPKKRITGKSPLQSKLLASLAAGGLPTPTEEHRFHPVRKWRLDLAYPDLKLGIEIQGGTFMRRGRHSGGAGQHGDYDKLNAAQILGWRILYFDTVHINKDMEGTILAIQEMYTSLGGEKAPS